MHKDVYDCVVCDRHLLETDTHFSPSGEILCSRCFYKEYGYCENCSKAIHSNDGRDCEYGDDGLCYCLECYDEIFVNDKNTS